MKTIKKLINKLMCKAEYPDPNIYPRSWSEGAEMDRGYEAWCADCGACDHHNQQTFFQRFYDIYLLPSALKREEKRREAALLFKADDYDPFEN